MSYDVQVAPKAAKEIERLDRAVRDRVVSAIRGLGENPRPDGCKKMKGNFAGAFRISVADNYRVIYEVTDKIRLVLVVKVGKRGDIY